MQLQDGMVTTVQIDNGKNVTFFYQNPSKTLQLIAIITFANAQQMNNALIKLSYSNEQNSTEDVTPTIPQTQKKTPHPTMVFDLPIGYE